MEELDVSLPGRGGRLGRLHPIPSTMRRMRAAFGQMGFQVFEGRDVESDDYNFTLLNTPPYHPARDSHDTFYTTRPDVLLRTHTSPAQIRVMRQTGAPVRAVVPGTCYRVDQPDASHNFQFYQMEGLAVGSGIRMGDLLGAITSLARMLFGAGSQVRFRAHYFPFTEPSLEADLRCTVCGGAGCRLCKDSGWVEIIPGGMIHPVVLRNGGLDSARVTGFAFGAGVDRIAALWYRIPDIRLLYDNDLRFLEQF
jgi:phenylalanyl-tRNA synthetase alpha chain